MNVVSSANGENLRSDEPLKHLVSVSTIGSKRALLSHVTVSLRESVTMRERKRLTGRGYENYGTPTSAMFDVVICLDQV